MNIKIKIKKENIIAFLLIFPFIPVNVLNVATGDVLYDVLAFADIIFILMLCFRNRYKFNAMEICLSFYVIILCVSCALNGNSIIPGIYYGGKLLTFVLINNFYLKVSSTTLLRVTEKYMAVLIIINTVFQFVAQGAFGYQATSGNYNNFLVGDNLLGYYYVPYIVLSIVLDKIDIGKISNKTKLMILVCTASLIKAWSGKSLIGIAMILVYLLFFYRRKIAKLLTFDVLAVAFVAVFVGIVFFNVQEYFSNILELLQKDATLTGRTYIWISSLNLIKESPIYGYGTVNGGMLELSSSYAGNAVGSHNIILEVILQTGFLGLVFYILFLAFSLRKKTGTFTKDEKDDYLMMLFMVFTILIMFISSMTIYTIIAYLPMILCYNVNKLEMKKAEQGG